MSGQKERTIILPIDQKEYHRIIDNKTLFTEKIILLTEQHPEIFPTAIRKGFWFVGFSKNEGKMDIARRIIRLKSAFNSYEDYLLHPCLVMTNLKGNTTKISEGLYLRKYNTPFHVIAKTLGKNSMYWYRAEIALSQYNIVGTTVKNPSKLPRNLLIDEHHTKLIRSKIYVCTTVGENCFLGASISPSMQYEDLKKSYGIFKSEAKIIEPNYSPKSINIDGYKSTKKAVVELYQDAGILRCFLHSFLKIRSCGTKAYDLYFDLVAQRVWNCYFAKNKRSFSLRISQLQTWTEQVVPPSPFKQSILKLCEKKRVFGSL